MTTVATAKGETMSVSKWAYDPEMCNDQICPGDCEFCRIWLDREDEEADEEYEDDFEEERRGYK